MRGDAALPWRPSGGTHLSHPQRYPGESFVFKDNPRTSTKRLLYFCYELEKVRTLERVGPSSLVRLSGPMDGHPDRFVSLE